MKRCPTCNRSYADDTLSFCLEDGTRLASAYDPEATLVAQPRPPAPAPSQQSQGLSICLFEFIDPTSRLLEVVTEGEEDEAGTYHARVSRVYLKKK